MGFMFFPLLLLHIPALLAYLKTDHVMKDMYAVRKNACSVLQEYMSLVSSEQFDGDRLRAALLKCKKSTDDVASMTYGSLLVMHEALNKKTPHITRPITDPTDACHVDAWNHESSFIRELFGMQCNHPALGVTHPLVVDVRQSTQLTLKQGIQETLGNTTSITRAPLVLACLLREGMTFTTELTFGNVAYSVFGFATNKEVVVRKKTRWYAHSEHGWRRVASLQDILAYKPRAIVYQRSPITAVSACKRSCTPPSN